MDESNNTAAVAALLSGLFSAGAFKFYESTLKFLMDLKSEVAALTVEVGYLQRENRKLQRDPRH
jgi:hypothetical protein